MVRVNPASLVHTCSVERCERIPTALNAMNATWETVVESMRCLMAPLKGYQKDSMMGRINGAQYRMTWLTEDVRNGDRVLWDDRTWLVQDRSKDSTSPWCQYYSAVLVETR